MSSTSQLTRQSPTYRQGMAAAVVRAAAASRAASRSSSRRTAPSSAASSAQQDVLAAYRWLVRHYPQAPVLVSGDFAGGGLALSLALALRDSGESADRAVAEFAAFASAVAALPPG